ncbi:MAG: hypothetical protein WD603_00280 [Patescibacteria group bacterium]
MKRYLPVTLLSAVAAAVLLPETASAQGGFFNIPQTPRSVGLDDLVRILVQFIRFGMLFAAAVAVLFIVVNGYQYILSAGNPEKVEKAKQGLTWSITGFILTVSSYAIVVLLQRTLDASLQTRVSRAPGIGGAIQGAPGSASGILARLFEIFLAFGGAAAVLFLILGGYRYVTSQGNQDQVEAARKTILYSVIGLAVVFLSYVIVVTTIQATRG